MNYHKLSGLKEHKHTTLNFLISEIQNKTYRYKNQGVSSVGFIVESPGENLCSSSRGCMHSWACSHCLHLQNVPFCLLLPSSSTPFWSWPFCLPLNKDFWHSVEFTWIIQDNGNLPTSKSLTEFYLQRGPLPCILTYSKVWGLVHEHLCREGKEVLFCLSWQNRSNNFIFLKVPVRI